MLLGRGRLLGNSWHWSLKQQRALLPPAPTGELSSLAAVGSQRSGAGNAACWALGPDNPLPRLMEGPWSGAAEDWELDLTLSLPASSSSSDQNSVGALPELSRYSEPFPPSWALHGSGLGRCMPVTFEYRVRRSAGVPCSPSRGISSADMRLWFGFLTPWLPERRMSLMFAVRFQSLSK